MLECTGMQLTVGRPIHSLRERRMAWQTGQPPPAALPVGGTEYVPRREFWWGESDLHSHLARLADLCS